jgi:hypothetical protein
VISASSVVVSWGFFTSSEEIHQGGEQQRTGVLALSGALKKRIAAFGLEKAFQYAAGHDGEGTLVEERWEAGREQHGRHLRKRTSASRSEVSFYSVSDTLKALPPEG